MKNIFLFLLVLTGCIASAQSLTDKKLIHSIDEILAKQFKPNEPGIAVLVARKGKVIYEKAFGSANVELQVPLQPDMVFRIGSVSKQFTAIAILQLFEQGKLSLNDSLQKYIPGFPSKKYSITIENLLTHTSGIGDYMAKDDPDPFIERRDFTPQQLVDYVRADSLMVKPGTQFIYSNTNYVLLGMIIEKISGMSYHKYVKENILNRAGLSNSYYAPEKVIIPKRVPGYRKGKEGFENTSMQSISLGYACGDLLSTVGDLYKWNKAVVENKLLKKEITEKAFTPFTLQNGYTTHYGYGYIIDTLYGKRCFRHDGSVSGFGADTRYFPDEDVYMAFLINGRSNETDRRTTEVVNNISLLVLGKPVRRAIKLSTTVLEQYTGTYAINEEHMIFVTIEKGQLFIEGSNPSDRVYKIPVYPSAENKFFVKPVDFEITFIKDEGGKVVKLITTYGGKVNLEWKKVK
jgi:CubicO group peptidase (beta-lactamase class C family)